MSETLRLALLSPDHPRETARGTGHIIAQLARRFARAGHEVTVYYPVNASFPLASDEWEGTRVMPVAWRNRARLPFGPNLEYSWEVARRLSPDLDVVVGHNEWGGASVMRRVRRLRRPGSRRGPVGVQAFHGIALRFLQIGRGGRPPRIRPQLGYYPDWLVLRAIEGGAARTADAVVACSRAIGGEAGALYHLPREKIHVIYNGVEPQPAPTAEERSAARASLGLADGTLVLSFVGEDVRRKGLDVAVRTVQLLRARGQNVVLLNIGNPWPSSEGVRSFGIVDEPTKRALLVASDLFFLPTHYEGLPAVVQEAAALCLPVVTTPAAHVEWGSPGRDFFLLDPTTPEAAADLIGPLAGSAELRRSVAGAGLREIGRRGYDLQAEQYLDLFRGLLSGSRR